MPIHHCHWAISLTFLVSDMINRYHKLLSLFINDHYAAILMVTNNHGLVILHGYRPLFLMMVLWFPTITFDDGLLVGYCSWFRCLVILVKPPRTILLVCQFTILLFRPQGFTIIGSLPSWASRAFSCSAFFSSAGDCGAANTNGNTRSKGVAALVAVGISLGFFKLICITCTNRQVI